MKEILDFLTELSCNNNREWFNAHKDWYRDCHLRFEQFTANWLARLADIDPELASLQPKDCIWRIYRDVRFSHDKRPFKEWFGVFPAAKAARKAIGEGIIFTFNLTNAYLLGEFGVRITTYCVPLEMRCWQTMKK
jgi:uncharacterized protein (TIGR02453 family)